MKNIIEAIINRKQTTTDIVMSPDSQMDIFHQQFVWLKNPNTPSPYNPYYTILKNRMVIHFPKNALRSVSNYDGFNTNFFELDAENWLFPKEIAFTETTNPKTINLKKKNLTITFKGKYIDGFKFIGDGKSNIVFYLQEDQVLTNCDFREIGEGKSIICILQKGAPFLTERLGNIYKNFLAPAEEYDARFNPLTNEKWNVFRSVLGGSGNNFSNSQLFTRILVLSDEKPVDTAHTPDIQERDSNKQKLNKGLQQFGPFYRIELNTTTV